MIIGITGWFASGKDTVADYLVKKNFKSISLSDAIRDELRKEGKELSRDNMRDMGNKLRDKFGAEYLAKKALEKISENESVNFVVTSIRQPAEVKILRAAPEFTLWSIDAPAKTRYQRLLERARTEDERSISFEDFLAKEEKEKHGAANAQQVDVVVAMADKILDNSGTFDQLYENIDKLISEAK